MAKDNGGSNESIVPVKSTSGEIKPRGLLDAVGYLEQSFANEKGGAKVDPDFLTSPLVVEFQEVALLSGLGHGLTAILLTPISLLVISGIVPIFGNPDPTLFDVFCGLLLALAHPLGYTMLISYAATRWLGPYSKKMAVQLLSGTTFAWLIKGFITVILFHWLYFMVLTKARVVAAVKLFYRPDQPAGLFNMSHEKAVSVLDFLLHFRETLITSSWLVAVAAVFFVVIPWLSFVWAGHRNKAWIEAGSVEVYLEGR